VPKGKKTFFARTFLPLILPKDDKALKRKPPGANGLNCPLRRTSAKRTKAIERKKSVPWTPPLPFLATALESAPTAGNA
jgi:hypothetical protein